VVSATSTSSFHNCTTLSSRFWTMEHGQKMLLISPVDGNPGHLYLPSSFPNPLRYHGTTCCSIMICSAREILWRKYFSECAISDIMDHAKNMALYHGRQKIHARITVILKHIFLIMFIIRDMATGVLHGRFQNHPIKYPQMEWIFPNEYQFANDSLVPCH